MNNLLYKILQKQATLAMYAKYIFLTLSMLGFVVAVASAQNTAATGATAALCQIFNTVRNIIFLLGITLVILGAAVYAAANIMPSQSKGGFQGYGMGMIIGGIIGVAIAVIAPYVINLIVSSAGSGILTSTGTAGVTGLCATTA
jgi:hypothetical protein